MQTYLVGGAVRDALLGLDVADRDWVVVGETPESMVAAGYTPVGKDFPVFLHPDTHEEYALARTERKSGPGYAGFTFNTSPTVTLDEDLLRRDITINAIAQTADGRLMDPCDGQKDLEARVIRHVSPAFIEDPVRILRVARFLARFSSMGFAVAEETLELMREMVSNGEVDHLVAERVWQEMERAFAAQSPRAFIETLRECSALARVLPEVDALFGVPQPAKHHPEIDSGVHTLMVLDQATAMSKEVDTRFAALCHDLGKGTTPHALWPKHHEHEDRGADLTANMTERLRTPKKTRELAILAARWHTHVHRVVELRAATLADLLHSLDPARRPERFEAFLQVCEADARGRLGLEHRDYPQADLMRVAARAWLSVDAGAIAQSTDDKKRIPEAVREARIAALRSSQRHSDDN